MFRQVSPSVVQDFLDGDKGGFQRGYDGGTFSQQTLACCSEIHVPLYRIQPLRFEPRAF